MITNSILNALDRLVLTMNVTTSQVCRKPSESRMSKRERVDRV
jgi:hypothetical protein